MSITNLNIRSSVLRGNQLGRTIGFPTLNLNADVIPSTLKSGVYTSQVTIHDKHYLGALYFGPRLVLNETKQVLEIYVFDFDQEIYGQTVEFQIGVFVREVMNFNSFAQLQDQLQIDKEEVKRIGFFKNDVSDQTT